MSTTVAKPNKLKFLPLREISLNSRPLVKRAIQFSCDGDLAVAADDSVHVFVPEFPDLSERRERIKAGLSGQAADDDGFASDLGGDDEGGPTRYNQQTLRAQYSEGSKHMPVSYPPLDPRVNRELFLAENMPFPYEGAVGADADAQSADGNDESAESDAYETDEDGGGEGASLGFNRPYGAGYGPITGVGSSMNHVVCIGWSPSGLGVNRRPVLGVLTGSGTLAVFGDDNGSANILPRANEGMLQRRELSGWIVLWGVGERLLVPGQQTEISEYIRGFAWAREIAPGQALLATVNDVDEVALISVQTVLAPDDGRPRGDPTLPAEPQENLVWMVREVARFKVEDPHEPIDPLDLDWVPCGTSFGLRWGPWLPTPEGRTCVLSFVGRNYVGFRRITIKDTWIRGEPPNLTLDSDDVYGMCVHLSTDALVEFEDATWNQGSVITCRGLISTGFDIKQFDVPLSADLSYRQTRHSAWDCGTVYRAATDDASQNPITDLVVHPPDLTNPSPTPLYTLVRLSATATTKDWYQTNIPPPDDPAADPRPQWVRTVAQKLDVQVPIDLHLTRAYDDDSASEASASGSENGDSDLGMDDDIESDAEEEAVNGADQATVLEVPEIHPHRFRMHGLTLSPGGGVTAVLVSSHSTQHPERGGWHTVRSSILFGHKPWRRRLLDASRLPHPPPSSSNCGVPVYPQLSEKTVNPTDPDPRYAHLTTEAKLFESLYGGGPKVPGVHYPAAPATMAVPAVESRSHSRTNSMPPSPAPNLRDLFAPALAAQTCDLCGAPMDARRGPLSGCRNGHFFGTCATSGLAVQTPGGTRSCGACGLRTLRAEVLLSKVPAADGRRDAVRRLVGEGLCGACGGKFLT